MNFPSLAVHPLIFPSQHKTSLTQASPAKRVSPSPLSQRLGVTFVNEAGGILTKADAYKRLIDFFSHNLNAVLETYLSGRTPPTEKELKTWLGLLEADFENKARLLAALPDEIKVRISLGSDPILTLYEREVDFKTLRDCIDTALKAGNGSSYTNALKYNMPSDTDPNMMVPIISIIDDKGNLPFITHHLRFHAVTKNIPYNPKFNRLMLQFTELLGLSRRTSPKTKQPQYWWTFHQVMASPIHKRIPKEKIAETPLMQEWSSRKNRTTLSIELNKLSRTETRSISTWIWDILRERMPDYSLSGIATLPQRELPKKLPLPAPK
ncbi:MAG: hypothetical protein ACK551_01215 [Vampirovibrionales bacterium]